ncbi:MAG: aromatic ring-hydroxylating dioxygenase subunit alpha [Rhodospirillales bacterium]
MRNRLPWPIARPCRCEAEADRLSLPARIYGDAEFLAAERERVFRPSWQVVCHLSDIPVPGRYHTLDFLGRNDFVVRGADLEPRAFYNVCRHRAARLLDGATGQCGSRIVCPYHAWTYGLDGRLIGLPERQEFSHMDQSRHGLVPLEVEGLSRLRVRRMEGDGPRVAEMMAPYDAELAPYRLEELVPLGRVTLRERAVTGRMSGTIIPMRCISGWPIGADAAVRQGLRRGVACWVDKMWGGLLDEPSANLSERLYQKYLPDVEYLPPERKRLWSYYKLWPNIAFDVYPDQIDFMQSIPMSPTRTVIRRSRMFCRTSGGRCVRCGI